MSSDFIANVRAAGEADNFSHIVKVSNPEEIGSMTDAAALPTPSAEYANRIIRLTTTGDLYYLNAAETAWIPLQSRPNILINSDGGNAINQRAIAAGDNLTSNSYCFDRWYVLEDCTAVNAAVQSGGGLRLTATTAGAGTYCSLSQKVENYASFAGKTLTLSARVKSNNANTKLSIYDGTTLSYSAAHTGGGGWEILTVTATVGASPSVLSAAMLQAGGLSDGKYAEFLWVKLEEGANATPWLVPDPAEELARCQRYYRRVGRGMSGRWNSATTVQLTFLISPQMIVAPTLALLTTTPSIDRLGIAPQFGTGSTIIASESSPGGVRYVTIDGFSGSVDGAIVSVNTEFLIGLDAEL